MQKIITLLIISIDHPPTRMWARLIPRWWKVGATPRFSSYFMFLLQKMKSFVWLLSFLCLCVCVSSSRSHTSQKVFFFFFSETSMIFLQKHQISFVTKKWACKQRAAVQLCERHGSKHKGDCSCVVSRLCCRHKSDRVKTSLSRYVLWKAIKS